MDHSQLVLLLSRVTGLLAPGPGTSATALADARKALAAAVVGGQLVNAYVDPPAAPPGPFLDELPPAVREELERIASEILPTGGDPGLRVFRRELPVPIAGTPDSVPIWADGWAAEKSLGPFVDADGRQVWLDLRVERPQVSIVNALGGAVIGTIPHAGPVSASETVTLAAGSFWWSARQFDPASPFGTYMGVRVRSGTLRFSTVPTVVATTIGVPPGTTIVIDLTLDPPALPVSVTGQPGGDARSARVTLPRDIQLTVTVGGGGSLTSDADAEAEAYRRHRALPQSARGASAIRTCAATPLVSVRAR